MNFANTELQLILQSLLWSASTAKHLAVGMLNNMSGSPRDVRRLCEESERFAVLAEKIKENFK